MRVVGIKTSGSLAGLTDEENPAFGDCVAQSVAAIAPEPPIQLLAANLDHRLAFFNPLE